MKKILLASTMLVGTAGFAAADNANFTFSGSAYAGVGYNMTTSTFGVEVTSNFTAGMMTTTDMGLEAGTKIKITAPGVSFDDDHTSTTFGAISTTGMAVSESAVYLSGDFGKFEVVYDANGAGATYDVNFKYSNSFGDFDIAAYYTFDPTGTNTNGDMGATGTYNFGDYSVYASFDWDNSVTDYVIGFGGDASFNGFGLGVDVDYDNNTGDWDWAANASYASGAYSIGAFIEDDGTDDQYDFGADAAYDLGGGVAIEAQYVYDADSAQGLVTAGVSMSF